VHWNLASQPLVISSHVNVGRKGTMPTVRLDSGRAAVLSAVAHLASQSSSWRISCGPVCFDSFGEYACKAILVPAEPNFSPKQGKECPHAPTRRMSKKASCHEVGSVPAKETRIGSVHESDNLDRAFVRACAEPFVQ